MDRYQCRAHARCAFFELPDTASQIKKRRKGSAVIAPLAAKAIRRTGYLAFERTIIGQSPGQRQIVGAQHSFLLLADLRLWLAEQAQALMLIRYRPARLHAAARR